MVIFLRSRLCRPQKVLSVFLEVENALSDIEQYSKEFKSSQESYLARKTLQISKDRYYQGLIFYLDHINSERDELDSEGIRNNLCGLRFIATI